MIYKVARRFRPPTPTDVDASTVASPPERTLKLHWCRFGISPNPISQLPQETRS